MFRVQIKGDIEEERAKKELLDVQVCALPAYLNTMFCMRVCELSMRVQVQLVQAKTETAWLTGRELERALHHGGPG